MKTVVKISLFALVVIAFVGCGTKSSVKYKQEQSERDRKLASKPSSSFKYNMQPYSVFGKTYNPTFVSVGEQFVGTASWYGPDFHSKLTANGETYDMHADTAAHKTLPINTMVKVENQENGKVAIVRINDRGPFVEGRIIDLSFTAGKKIGIENRGIAPVKLTILGFDSLITKGTKDGEKRVVGNYGVQIGAYKAKESAQRFASENSSVDGVYKSMIKSYETKEGMLYRVFLSGFHSEAEARDFIKTERFKGSYIISLE